LTPADNFEAVFDYSSVIVIQYEDRKNENWRSFDNIYRSVATSLMHKVEEEQTERVFDLPFDKV
jgi:hypothetical protein